MLCDTCKTRAATGILVECYHDGCPLVWWYCCAECGAEKEYNPAWDRRDIERAIVFIAKPLTGKAKDDGPMFGDSSLNIEKCQSAQGLPPSLPIGTTVRYEGGEYVVFRVRKPGIYDLVSLADGDWFLDECPVEEWDTYGRLVEYVLDDDLNTVAYPEKEYV